MNDETIDTKHIDQDIELVSIDDLRTAFGGEDLASKPETETQLVNIPTVMCAGWNP